MRIFLTVPLSDERFNAIPDIGLGYLATCCREAGHEVYILDCLLEKSTMADFIRCLKRYKPDVLGIKTYSCDIKRTDEMCQEARQILVELITILGGPHPSSEIPERIFHQIPNAQYAFAGEAEAGLPEFLARFVNGTTDFENIPGLIWRDDTGAVRANSKVYTTNLDTLSFPAWDLIDPRKYNWGYSYMTTKLPAAPMVMTRGCPFRCTFCGSHLITGRHVRKRSVDNIINEMKMLRRDYGVQTIDIVDENFAFDREFLIEFCQRMISEKPGLLWNCPYGVRLTNLDEEVIVLMEKAGCFGVSVGVESGSDRILKLIRKGLTRETVVQKVQLIKRLTNMMVQGYFIIGFPGETRNDIHDTIELARSLPFDLVTFCPLRVTPGTEIFTTLLANSVISLELDYAGLGQHYFVRSYCDIPEQEMQKLYRRAYFRFYFRLKVVLNLMKRMSSPAHVKIILNGLWRLIGSHHKKD
ncbi:B12-binding domain-containing radical SAM protein [candidate division CSSED10-310 bacterium]|uniref:B12-binding domain-containing radical SAM protein n=1 Tax=candidate division CSSED10-310 bacterium TaxID=2855610 RepID=A0ABV6YX39_UNCC1